MKMIFDQKYTTINRIHVSIHFFLRLAITNHLLQSLQQKTLLHAFKQLYVMKHVKNYGKLPKIPHL